MRAERLYEFGFSAFKRTVVSAQEVFPEPGPGKHPEDERRHLVAMFAHDLKTPVMATLGLLNRLRRGKKGSLSQVQAGYVNTIYKQIQRLEEIINQFLEFACAESHFITPKSTAIHVEDECREILALLQPLAEAKGIELKGELPEDILVLYADRLLLRRALENLLINAIKYSPPKSCVVLEVRGNGPAVQFAVRDQGPGIPPQDLTHLFEDFYRGAASYKQEGFGLGLAAVKRIIEAHGGHIWVETDSGQGTTFFFTLPR